jgi:hypothetical protein
MPSVSFFVWPSILLFSLIWAVAILRASKQEKVVRSDFFRITHGTTRLGIVVLDRNVILGTMDDQDGTNNGALELI